MEKPQYWLCSIFAIVQNTGNVTLVRTLGMEYKSWEILEWGEGKGWSGGEWEEENHNNLQSTLFWGTLCTPQKCHLQQYKVESVLVNTHPWGEGSNFSVGMKSWYNVPCVPIIVETMHFWLMWDTGGFTDTLHCVIEGRVTRYQQRSSRRPANLNQVPKTLLCTHELGHQSSSEDDTVTRKNT